MSELDDFDDIIEEERGKDGNLSNTQTDPDFCPNRSKRKRNQSRPKVIDTFSWSDDDINKLISGVETHQCIWNAANEDYKNRTHT